MSPGTCISQQQFMQVLKRHMHTAATVAAGLIPDHDLDHQIGQIGYLGQNRGSPRGSTLLSPTGTATASLTTQQQQSAAAGSNTEGSAAAAAAAAAAAGDADMAADQSVFATYFQQGSVLLGSDEVLPPVALSPGSFTQQQQQQQQGPPVSTPFAAAAAASPFRAPSAAAASRGSRSPRAAAGAVGAVNAGLGLHANAAAAAGSVAAGRSSLYGVGSIMQQQQRQQQWMRQQLLNTGAPHQQQLLQKQQQQQQKGRWQAALKQVRQNGQANQQLQNATSVAGRAQSVTARVGSVTPSNPVLRRFVEQAIAQHAPRIPSSDNLGITSRPASMSSGSQPASPVAAHQQQQQQLWKETAGVAGQQQQQQLWGEHASIGVQQQQQHAALCGGLSMVPSAAAQEEGEVCETPSVHQLNPSVHQLNPSVHQLNPSVHQLNPRVQQLNPLQLQPSGLAEARTLRDIGDIILLQHLQQQMEQQQQDEQQQQQHNATDSPLQDDQQPDQLQQQQHQGWVHVGEASGKAQGISLDHVAIPTDELQQIRRRSSAHVSEAVTASTAAAAAAASRQFKQQPGDASHSKHGSQSSAATAAAAAAAATALASARQLPGVREQLWVVVVRCGRKWVSSRQNLMTDLLLTALLGLALGVAQVGTAA
jgi:hypothetical protein